MARPRLALVPGEPAGVGPELCVRAAQRSWDANLLAFGDGATLQRAAAALGLPLALAAPDADSAPGVLPLRAMPAAEATGFGTPHAANAASKVSPASSSVAPKVTMPSS